MEKLNTFDVLVCPGCGLALAMATEDIEAGTMHWAEKLKPVGLSQMPALGTPQEACLCPQCSTQWFPNFRVERAALVES